jgi:hypothetical protein
MMTQLKSMGIEWKESLLAHLVQKPKPFLIGLSRVCCFLPYHMDIGFSIIPKFGSIYTFIAPSTLAVQWDVTLHRPHKSRIELSLPTPVD